MRLPTNVLRPMQGTRIGSLSWKLVGKAAAPGVLVEASGLLSPQVPTGGPAVNAVVRDGVDHAAGAHVLLVRSESAARVGRGVVPVEGVAVRGRAVARVGRRADVGRDGLDALGVRQLAKPDQRRERVRGARVVVTAERVPELTVDRRRGRADRKGRRAAGRDAVRAAVLEQVAPVGDEGLSLGAVAVDKRGAAAAGATGRRDLGGSSLGAADRARSRGAAGAEARRLVHAAVEQREHVGPVRVRAAIRGRRAAVREARSGVVGRSVASGGRASGGRRVDVDGVEPDGDARSVREQATRDGAGLLRHHLRHGRGVLDRRGRRHGVLTGAGATTLVVAAVSEERRRNGAVREVVERVRA